MRLSELNAGEKGIIVKVTGRGAFRKRIIEMGFIRGKEVEVIKSAPLKDPVQYRIMDYDVSLRRADARLIEVVSAAEYAGRPSPDEDGAPTMRQEPPSGEELRDIALEKSKTINVALVGNPNCGKTSLFNCASGAHEHVGNYGGVTIEAKEGVFRQNGYTFRLVDLPGTYSLSAYSPEELYVRKHLNEELPDVIVNVVDASNIERNLFLTCQLIDMDARMVVALNMYDELEKQGSRFDHASLSALLGIPMVPTVGKTGTGIEALFDRVVQVYEGTDPVLRPVRTNYGKTLEHGIAGVEAALKEAADIPSGISRRYLAVKLLERDKEAERAMAALPGGNEVLQERDRQAVPMEQLLKQDCETALTDARYDFIDSVLRKTFRRNKPRKTPLTRRIDRFATGRFLGFPIFILFMWVMFEVTFRIGDYPMQWIEALVGTASDFVRGHTPDGPLKDLLADGIIGGVGGVLVFLPNIVILYAFISFMEDSGYMARAAFIMDKLMHKMGLHGKSFIPLVMGFGCSVPAVMASRTIESRNSRMVTMLVTPLMSCSARLPVYVLLAGVFFPACAGTVLLGLYLTGIVLAVVVARIFRSTLFKGEDVPFVMELPPYRMPTAKAILLHIWEKAKQYLYKIGSIILVASIIIWFLSYFPRHTPEEERIDSQIALTLQGDAPAAEQEKLLTELEHRKATVHQQNSYMGLIGETLQPILAPLGFDWKMSVSLLTGMAAKEVVVSTLSVLYVGEATDEGSPRLDRMLQSDRYADGSPVFTPLVALSFMLFVLIYFPCMATVSAIVHESGSWKWGLFVIGYTCTLAWMVSFIVYQAGNLLMGGA